MADFTAKEMRKLANLMESAINGGLANEGWEDGQWHDKRPEEEKLEHADICNMIYQIAYKHKDDYLFDSMLMAMTNQQFHDLGDLKDPSWVTHAGSFFEEPMMVNHFVYQIYEEFMPGNDVDEENGADFIRLAKANMPKTFKELIVLIEKYYEIANQRHLETGAYGYQEEMAEMIPYIKILDTLPLL